VNSASFATSNDALMVERTDEVVVFNETEKVLMAIENIPVEVIEQGAESTAEWLQNETGIGITLEDGENLIFDLPEEQRTVNTSPIVSPGYPIVSPDLNVPACIVAVGIAIVSNALPFTKITKVKSALQALGGTTAAINKIKKRYDIYRYGGFTIRRALQKAMDDVSSGLSSTLKAAFLDLFNLTSIIANCGFALNVNKDKQNPLSLSPKYALDDEGDKSSVI
jgi:hypothetical protein